MVARSLEPTLPALVVESGHERRPRTPPVSSLRRSSRRARGRAGVGDFIPFTLSRRWSVTEHRLGTADLSRKVDDDSDRLANPSQMLGPDIAASCDDPLRCRDDDGRTKESGLASLGLSEVQFGDVTRGRHRARPIPRWWLLLGVGDRCDLVEGRAQRAQPCCRRWCRTQRRVASVQRVSRRRFEHSYSACKSADNRMKTFR